MCTLYIANRECYGVMIMDRKAYKTCCLKNTNKISIGNSNIYHSEVSLAIAKQASATMSGSLMRPGSIPKTLVTCVLIGVAGHNDDTDTPKTEKQTRSMLIYTLTIQLDVHFLCVLKKEDPKVVDDHSLWGSTAEKFMEF